jgi:iron(III) transport system substrate-binding protein
MGEGCAEKLAAVFAMARRAVKNVIYLVIAAVVLAGCGTSHKNAVTVYVSEDQVFSEPILKDFEKETGIKVNAVFDTEEAKSTGVMNRLLAEKNNPQADVYWANEPVRADVLRQQGISFEFRPENGREIPDQFKDPRGFWTGFSARARVLLVNQSGKGKPSGVRSYVDPKMRARASSPIRCSEPLRRRWRHCFHCGVTRRETSSSPALRATK